LLGDQSGGRYRGELDDVHRATVGLPHPRDLGREARLADATRSDDGDQSMGGECTVQRTDLVVAADERVPADRRPERGRSPSCRLLDHVGDEPVAAPVHGPDHLLAPSVVADDPAGVLDAGGEGGFAHEAVTPDGVEQLVLGDHAVAVACKVEEYLEDLRLDMDLGAADPDRHGRWIDVHVAEPNRLVSVTHVRRAYL